MSKRFGAFRMVGTFAVVLLIVFVASCAKQPFNIPPVNQAPETFISAVDIVKVSPKIDETGTKFLVKVQYYGLDPDGLIKAYRYKIDTGNWTDWITATTSVDTVAFTSEDELHTYYVQSKDDRDKLDETPATATLSLKAAVANSLPETEVLAGPPNGAVTSGGFTVELLGKDFDGSVASFQYRVDGGNWASVAADELGKGKVQFSEANGNVLSDGTHAIEIKAVDNLGGADPTPIFFSVHATSTRGFKPLVSVTSGPGPGATYFVAAGQTSDFSISFAGDASYYYGDVAGYSFSTDSLTWSAYSTDNDTTLAGLGAGIYNYWIRCKDLAGNVTETPKTTFYIVVPTFAKPILLVNGVSWSVYGDEIVSFYEDKVIFDDFPIDTWDLFGAPATYPSTFPTPLANEKNVTGDVLKDYASLIWVGNNYAGDLPYWYGSLSLIKSYLKAGGKLILATRYGSTFFNDAEFQSQFCHITGFTGSYSIKKQKSLLPELVDVESWASLTHGITGLDDSGLAEPFYEDPDNPGTWLGVRVKLTADGPWQIVLVMGRPYRMNHEQSRTNYAYILENWFGLTK